MKKEWREAARSEARLQDRLRDCFADSIARLPAPLQRLAFGRFRRYMLWWIFRAYGREVTLAPAGPAGNRFYMKLHPMAYSDFIVGIYEPGCVRVLREHVSEGSVCVDIGANLGYLSILMSQLAGAEGQIIAFEPMPDTLELLRENVAINGLRNIMIVAAAASDVTGSADLLSEADENVAKTASMVGYRLEGPGRVTNVRSLRLDDYFSGSARLPNVVKIDVEGAETMVLRGARETIARSRPLLLVEVHAWESSASRDVLQLLSDFGYRTEIVELRPPEALCLAKPLESPNA